MTLATRIKQLDLSKTEFATLVHTAPSSASRWFNGQRAEPHWISSWLDMYEMLTPQQRAALKSRHLSPAAKKTLAALMEIAGETDAPNVTPAMAGLIEELAKKLAPKN
jgi:hypothetical protein